MFAGRGFKTGIGFLSAGICGVNVEAGFIRGEEAISDGVVSREMGVANEECEIEKLSSVEEVSRAPEGLLSSTKILSDSASSGCSEITGLGVGGSNVIRSDFTSS